MFGNQKDFSPHSVGCALTAQGGEADLKFTEMSTLVWSDFDLKRWKHGTEDTLSSFFRLKFLQLLSYRSLGFFASSCGKKTFTVNVYIDCELSIPHTSWTCYLISGIVRVRYGSDVFACILGHHHYHYLTLTSLSLTAIFYLYICTTCHNPTISPVLFSWPLFIVGTHKSFV